MSELTSKKRPKGRAPHASAAGGWGCPHDDQGVCLKQQKPCQPGESGCVLEGRLPARTER